VVGFLLGYARAYSGSIWLPAFLHFLHNLVVMLW
jgi:membrane protease YdiL (CAAX protease family)